ncbi:hypothetical protein BLOT_000502 [Blomia tropicalis]|nr:hypothetical protein BLOT_000502 [Blomia tropicalis]
MDKNNSFSYGSLARSPNSEPNVATTNTTVAISTTTTSTTTPVTSVIELRPLSSIVSVQSASNVNGGSGLVGVGSYSNSGNISTTTPTTANNDNNCQPINICTSTSMPYQYSVSSTSAGGSRLDIDNQIHEPISPYILPRHSMAMSIPVFTATSTPEIRDPPLELANIGPTESGTCPILTNPNISLTPPIKIRIHRAPACPSTESISSPSSSVSHSYHPHQHQHHHHHHQFQQQQFNTNTPNPSTNTSTTTQGSMFVLSGALSSIQSKSHPGTVAAKLNRRRASSNVSTTYGPSGHQFASTLSTAQYAGTSRRKSWDQRVAGPIRRASQALINLANASGVLSAVDSASMGSVFGSGSGLYGECSRRDSRIRMPEIMLMYSSFQRLPMKDFGAEVRASMDVDQFLQQAVLLLDITETSLEGIVDRMLRKVIDGREPLTTLKEAKTALFTHDAGELQLLARTIQGTYISEGGGFDYDQSWLCAMCSLPSLAKRHVAIARLKHAANMGRNSHEVRFFVLVVTPSKEKGTKNALETGRTFATIFADMDFRQKLLDVHGEPEFKGILLKHAQDLASEQSNPTRRMGNHEPEAEFEEPKCHFAQGLCDDLRRRTTHYVSDYVDGLVGRKTIQKTISTIFFLYFACILPTIAFGVLNNNNTGGKIVIYNICEDFQLDFYAMYACVGLWNTVFLILYAVFDVSKLMKWCTRSTEEIFSLFISIAFAVDAGRDVVKNFQNHYYSQLCLDQINRTKGRQDLLEEFRRQANILAHSNIPNTADPGLMQTNDTSHKSDLPHPSNHSSNWTDMVLDSPFVTTTMVNLTQNGPTASMYNQSIFNNNVASNLPSSNATTLATFIWSQNERGSLQNLTSSALNLIFTDLKASEDGVCRRETSLLFLLLMLGTVWMAVSLFNFNKTPYLQASKRELLADYALPCSVIILSTIGSYVFRDIPVEHFRYDEEFRFKRARLEDLPWTAFCACMGLGFSLSLLFFMDQNISAAMVNNPCNKLKKGCAYHLDLFVVGILNGFLSLYGFPWMHGVLPHSPLHVRSLADVEERVDQGHVYEM